MRITKLQAFFLVWLPYVILGQTPYLDSLKTKLAGARTDSSRIYLNVLLSEQCDINDIPKYARPAIIESLGRLKQLKATNPLYNFYASNAALGINNLGFYEEKQGRFIKGKFYFQKSLEIYDNINDRGGVANELSNIASAYIMLSDIPQALEFYNKSIKIRESLNDKTGLAISFQNVGSIYEHLNDINKAIEYYNRSFKLREEIGDQNGMAHAYNIIGGIYLRTRDYQKALDHHQKSYRIWEKLNDRAGIAISLRCIARIQDKERQFDKAFENYNKSLVINKALDDKIELSLVYSGLADLMMVQNKLHAAQKYAEKSLEISNETSFLENVMAISKILGEIYSKTGDYKRAFEMSQLNKIMSDSIYKRSNETALIKNTFRYAYEKKALEEAVKTNQEKMIMQAKIEHKQTVNFGLFVCIGLSIMFSIIMFSRLRLINKQKLTIEAQRIEVELQKELAESEREIAEAQTQIAINSLEELKSAQKKLIEAKDAADKANKTKSEFVASMSHEIRTPLNAVLGFSELLKGNTKDAKYERYIEGILAGGKNLLSLIDDILDLSKIEAGRLIIQNAPVHITSLMNEINQFFAPKCEERDLGFTIQYDNKGFPKYLLLDETRIRQVIFNLLGNAIKFTHKGSVTLLLESLPSVAGTDKVDFVITVKDTGIGIPSDQQAAIFEAFKQQDGQNTRRYGGTGLGLTITKRLTEMMNGSIFLESWPDKGSSFSVRIPDVQVVNINTSPKIKPENSVHKFEGQTVLLVEDNIPNREVIKGFLEDTDLKIIIAENGQEAIDILKHVHPDIILMDMMMPVMDGYTASKIIRSDPMTKNIPILALTASALKHHEALIRELCNDYLRKPISKYGLIRVMSNYLEHSLIINNSPRETKRSTVHYVSIELKKKLILKFLPEWQKISSLMSIDDIMFFAKKLRNFGATSNSDAIKNYGDLLYSYADNFEIDKMNMAFNRFEELIAID